MVKNINFVKEIKDNKSMHAFMTKKFRIYDLILVLI